MGAEADDGRLIKLVGHGVLKFELWGCHFEEDMRIMRALPSKVLIGNSFWRKYALRLDLDKNTGSIRCRKKIFRGKVSNEEVNETME